MEKKFKEPIKKLFWGIFLILLLFSVWLHLIKNPFNEFALIIHPTQITTGYLVETIEQESEDDRGHMSVWEVGVYIYHLPDKREFKVSTEAPLGELKKNKEVEYLISNPAISRIKGDGCKSVIEWFLRKVALGLILLVLCLSPGFILIRNGICDIKKINTEASLPQDV